MKRLVVLTVAILLSACGGPIPQSTPAMPQQGTAVNGVAQPDGRCNYLQMQPTTATIKTKQQVGILPILRYKVAGQPCESLRLHATWTKTGGRTRVANKGRIMLFLATKPGTYMVTATVDYDGKSYSGQSTITVTNS